MLSKPDEKQELPKMHYFDGKGIMKGQDNVMMASYPRSGNTMLRSFLDRVLGVPTGSEADNTKGLMHKLEEYGLTGEGVYDKFVWVVKTHWPERFGTFVFPSNRAILLVRSPLDCIISLFHMLASSSHDKSISEADFKIFSTLWNEWQEQEIKIWAEFHEFWLRCNDQIPVHIVRYEDLCQRPKDALTEMMKFLFNVEDIADTRIEKFVEMHVTMAPPKVYEPRAGKIDGNRSKYTKKQIQRYVEEAGPTLKKFGYYDMLASETGELDLAPTFIKEWNEKALAKSI